MIIHFRLEHMVLIELPAGCHAHSVAANLVNGDFGANVNVVDDMSDMFLFKRVVNLSTKHKVLKVRQGE